MRFKNTKTGEIKTAFSYREDDEKVYIKFTETGKEYGYFKSNIEILDVQDNCLPFIVYAYEKECYKCHKPTEILTYITFLDDPTINVVPPYDKDRMLRGQDIAAHLLDPSIEYYGIDVIGDIEEYDNLLMQAYPDRIKNIFSQTKNRTYPMNVCRHCKNGQGWYYIYRDINQKIQEEKEIAIFGGK